MTTSWTDRRLPLMLFGLYLVLAVASVWSDSSVYDEHPHVVSGFSYLTSGKFSGGLDNPPLLQVLFALPAFVARVPYRPYVDDGLLWFRVPAILVGLLGALLVWAWSRRLYGPRGACLTLLLYVLCPTCLGLARYAVLDFGAAVFFVFALATAQWYADDPTVRRAAAVGAACGLAACTKFTILPVVAFAGLVLMTTPLGPRPDGGSWWQIWVEGLSRPFATAVALRLLVLAVAFVVAVDAVYLFDGVGTYRPLAPPVRASMGSVQAWCVELGGTFLPPDFVGGLLGKMGQARAGRPAFLLGTWSDGGWWYYQPLVLLMKTSTTVQLLSLLYVGLVLSGRIGWRIEEVRAAAPTAALLVVLCFSSRVNIGMRHVVFVLPVTSVLLAGLVPWFDGALSYRKRRMGTAFVVVALTATNLSVMPHYLAFFCSAVGGPADGYRVAIDSNLDWGQDDGRVQAWGRQRKVPIRTNVEPFLPQTGYLALSANCYQGLYHRTAAPDGRWAWDWLKRFEPIDRLGHTWFVDHAELDDYRTYAEAHPDDPSAWLDYAVLLMRNGQFKPSFDALQRADQAGTALKAAVLFRQGQLALLTGEPALAVRFLTDATILLPGDTTMEGYLTVARAVVALGDLERAGRKDAKDPDVLAQILVMVRQYGLLGEHAACQRYLQYLDRAGLDGNGLYWVHRGYSYRSMGKVDLAVQCLKRASELMPGDKDILDLLADLEHFQWLCTSDAAEHRCEAGRQFEDLRLYREAMEQYLKAHELDPAAPTPLWAMGALQIGRRLGSMPFSWP